MSSYVISNSDVGVVGAREMVGNGRGSRCICCSNAVT
jgi:hypothetical protein